VTLVALRGLLGRKFRALLTSLAIVLGVAMVSGSYILTDTIDKAFDEIFTESYAGTDAVVSGRAPDISFQGDTADTPPIPADLLEKVRALPEVEVATGTVADETATKILDENGKAVETQGAPSFGFGIDAAPELSRFNPLNLLEGRWPRGPNEVAIDAATADDQGYELGGMVGIATLQPAKEFELVGIARYGELNSIGSATFAVFDIPTAQALLDRKGQLDAIQVAAKEGISPGELVRKIEPILPQAARVRTGTAEAREETEEITQFTEIIRYFLLAFAGIALFVGAFVIFNTLSITVAQRTRELATLRTIGASRPQVLRSVVLEAFVIGVFSSIVGLGLGVALARGLNSLFKALEFDLPQTDMVFATRTIVVSLLVGIVVTVLAGVFPAIRATRVPPISAVKEGATLPRSRLAPFTPFIALGTTALSVAALVYSMFVDDIGTGDRFLLMGVGVLLLFVGIALMSPRLVRPLAGVVGWPAGRIGGAAGRLAQGNSTRNPGRTAATAAALMIGIALVTFVAVLAQGMKDSNRGAIERQVIADYVVTSQNGFEPFVAAAGDAARNADEAELVTDVRSDLGNVAGAGKYVTGIEPATITRAYRFDWKDGSDAILGSLGRNGAIIDKDFADEKNLRVGSTFGLLAPTGKRMQLVVKGIYEPPPFFPLLGSVSIVKARFDELYDRPRNQFTFVNVPGDPNDAAKASLDSVLASFPDAKVQTREEWIKSQDRQFNLFLNMLYVLLGLSVIISLFGMINTLALSVFERTRELGMLRAVGMTRRQVRRMVRHESVITALIGAALGLPLGIFLAALVTRALSEFDIEFAVPIDRLVLFSIIAILAGVLAAILPARRASRLRVLEALQYE
jgi:putative ABC transport system permease protein